MPGICGHGLPVFDLFGHSLRVVVIIVVELRLIIVYDKVALDLAPTSPLDILRQPIFWRELCSNRRFYAETERCIKRKINIQ